MGEREGELDGSGVPWRPQGRPGLAGRKKLARTRACVRQPRAPVLLSREEDDRGLQWWVGPEQELGRLCCGKR